MGYERAKRCAVSSEEKGETIIHGRASRVSPLKNIIPSGNSSRVCKKNLYTCLKCNLTANEREKGDVLRESEKERCDSRARRRLLSVSVIRRQCKIFARLWGRGKPQKQIVFQSIRFFASPLERYYEVSRGI